jgi:hypothetical protein
MTTVGVSIRQRWCHRDFIFFFVSRTTRNIIIELSKRKMTRDEGEHSTMMVTNSFSWVSNFMNTLSIADGIEKEKIDPPINL